MPFTPLPRSSPAAENVSALRLDDFERAIDTRPCAVAPDLIRGYLLIRNGNVVRERFWPPYRPDDAVYVYSLTKSFTSTAVGLAVDAGLLSVDDLVAPFFAEYDLPDNPLLRRMRVRDLLSMSTGHAEDTLTKIREHMDGDWARIFFNDFIVHEPGTHWLYNSGASHMLSLITQKVAGRTVESLMRDKVFEPLGFGAYQWQTDASGATTGGWGLMARIEDIAKLGLLYLNKGVWDGQRILSGAWVEQATRKQADNSIHGDLRPDWVQGYGYQFWVATHNAYRGDGAYGQYCVVMPEHNAVLALSCETDDMQAIHACIWDHVLPAMTEAASDCEAAVSGSYYAPDANEAGLTGIRFDFSSESCAVTLRGAGGEHVISAGRGHWLTAFTPGLPLGAVSMVDVRELDAGQDVSACFHWPDAMTLEVKWLYHGTPHQDKLICAFSGDGVTLTCPANRTGGAATAEIRGKRGKPLQSVNFSP